MRFYGPTLRLRLLFLKSSSETIAVTSNGTTYVGRVVSVGLDDFEIVLMKSIDTLAGGCTVSINFDALSEIEELKK